MESCTSSASIRFRMIMPLPHTALSLCANVRVMRRAHLIDGAVPPGGRQRDRRREHHLSGSRPEACWTQISSRQTSQVKPAAPPQGPRLVFLQAHTGSVYHSMMKMPDTQTGVRRKVKQFCIQFCTVGAYQRSSPCINRQRVSERTSDDTYIRVS